MTAGGSRLKARGKGFCLQPAACSLQPNGFTFVELSLAATMRSILFVGLGAHLQGGIRVWRRVTETVESVQRQRAAVERLERDMANAFVYGDPREDVPLPKPEFEADRLRWFTVGSATPDPTPRVRVVSYWCGSSGGSREGLWRASQTISEARSGAQPTTEVPLLPTCEDFSIRYGYLPIDETSQSLEWDRRWRFDATKEIPQLVDVSFTTSGRRIRRVFAIPVGVLKQKPAEEGGGTP